MKLFKKDSVPWDYALYPGLVSDVLSTINKPSDLEITKIDNRYANSFVKEHHYLKRKIYIGSNVSYGIMKNNICFGVIMYGYPVWTKYPGLCPPLLPAECPELCRLCTLGGLPRNTESYLIGATLKRMAKDWASVTGTTPKCVTSFCDITYGFNGSLYMATNFILFSTTRGRSANPGKPHGRWGGNIGGKEEMKHFYVYYYDRSKSVKGLPSST